MGTDGRANDAIEADGTGIAVLLVRRAGRDCVLPLALETMRLTTKKILAGDDGPTYLHQLAAQLRQAGYDVVVAQFEDETRSMREQLLHREVEATEASASRTLAETHAKLLSELQSTNEELVRTQRDLEDKNLRIESANRSKSEFLANMSHELRTPLNAILGFGELLHDGTITPDSPKHKEYLGHILTTGRHLLQLINDVLDLTKVEAGKIELRPEALDPRLVVGEVLTMLRATAARKQVKLELEVDPNLRKVVVDPARLRQVVFNYVSNGIKFTHTEGRVWVRLAPEGTDRFRIEVRDDGVGIAASDLDRLFVEFQRLDASSSKNYEGTGLGLAFTKRLVEAQGGSVGVASTLGSGSTFHAILPRVVLASEEGGA